MLVLFCIVIGILSVLGIVFLIVIVPWPKEKTLLPETKTIEFELETNGGIYRGKLRYRPLKDR